MPNAYQGRAAHSAEHFGDTRDQWWNVDFLRLVAQRWRLDAVRDALDVGSGVGHWGMLLASVMREDLRVTGLERETAWVEEARARAEARGLGGRFTFVPGDAQELPFGDASFDLVTCQTVLIHLRDPRAALAEMIRVTRPGGLVVVAEPNNLSESLLLDSVTNQASVEEIVELVRLQLTCERGKVALGEGDNSLGDRVPGLFAALGLRDVEVYVNDKASAMFPPYASETQRALADDLRDRTARRLWNWGEEEARRLFVAGGGDAHAFAASYARALGSRERIVRGIDDGGYHGVVGGPFYLVGGRKPR
jgi:SAM-dependent methyltransferase